MSRPRHHASTGGGPDRHANPNVGAPPVAEEPPAGAGGKRTKDFDIRAILVRALLDRGVGRDCIRHEITLDSSSSEGRADLVLLLQQELVGIEIKSGADDLTRLDQQRLRYGLAFDRFGIALDARHADAPGLYGYPCRAICRDGAFDPYGIEQILGGYWWSVTDASPRHMARLLWRAETEAITQIKTRCHALRHIGEMFTLRDLRPHVLAALRARDQNRWEEAFWRRFDAMGVVLPSDITDAAA